FAQQGSVDWLQLAKMTVSIPMSILTRLAAADITPMTIVVARNIASVFHISPQGYRRITESLGRLQSYSSLGDAVWFGFGIKHVVRDLGQSEQGMACLALCGAMSEIYPSKSYVPILMELSNLCGTPGELRPSPKQWLNLVEVCSGTMRSTTFGLIAGQFMAFHHAPNANKVPPKDDLKDVAGALQSLALVSSGALESITLAGGRSCGWIAAYGYCFLGLDVEIREGDSEVPLYRSAADGKRIGIFVEYRQPNRTEEHSEQVQVQVRKTSYFIKSVEDIYSSHTDWNHDGSMAGGFAPWKSCLAGAFGVQAVQRLLEPPVAFGALLGAAACVFFLPDDQNPGASRSPRVKRNSHANQSPRANRYGFRPGQRGRGFADSALAWFPELRVLQGHIVIDYTDSFDPACGLKRYERARREIQARCHCNTCDQHLPSTQRSAPPDGFCLATLAETIIFLIWNLSSMKIHPDLFPSRSGLRLIYNLRRSQLTELRATRDAKRWSLDDMMRYFLTPGSIYHTAQFLFTTCTTAQTACTDFSAASVRGICFYFDFLREISDRPEQAILLHVVPGSIETKNGTRYPYLRDTSSQGKSGEDGLMRLGLSAAPDTRIRESISPHSYHFEGIKRFYNANDLDDQFDTLASYTGSRDIQATLVVEETLDGLFTDIRFTGSKGTCQVGVYTMMRLVMEASHNVRCSGVDCDAEFNGDYRYIVLADGEGLLPFGPSKDAMIVRRLQGNAFARCIALLFWNYPLEVQDRAILRWQECIPCCLNAAA
ncbi:hypothetical protein B0T19DRAFT_343051, partial [Cercophora scortea]